MTTRILGELREYKAENNSSKPSTAFIDLATYENIEKSVYGGSNAITYFIRETVKSSWFTQIPVQLSMDEDNPNFGQTFSVKISREGDYLMNSWLRVSLGGVSIYYPNNSPSAWIDENGSGCETLAYTPNFMHNLVEKCTLKVNGMVLDEIYSEHLDFYSAFMIPKASRIGYNRMIGNFNKPFQGLSAANVSGYNTYQNSNNLNWQQELFLPLPFFFSKDTGLALPLTSLPYNDISIEFKFREFRQLLGSITKNGLIVPVNASQMNSCQGNPGVDDTRPRLENVQVWGNYAVVTEKERKKIGCIKRDMIIEQNQQLGESYGSVDLNVNDINSTTSIDLRFHGAVKALFFAARNSSGSTDLPYRSNYTTACPSASDIIVCKISASGATIGACVENTSDSWAGLEVVGTYSSGTTTPITVSGVNPGSIYAPYNTSCTVSGSGLSITGDALLTSITQNVVVDNGGVTVTGLSATSTTGAGSGAVFELVSNATPALGISGITVTTIGDGYRTGDSITFSDADLTATGFGTTTGSLTITLKADDFAPYTYPIGTTTDISYDKAVGTTANLTDFTAANHRYSSYWATQSGLRANPYEWGPRVLYSASGVLLGLVSDVNASNVTFGDGLLTPLKTNDYIFFSSYPPGAPAWIESGMRMYISSGSNLGNVTSVTSDTISINASNAAGGSLGTGTGYTLNDGDKLYYSYLGVRSDSTVKNGAPPPVNINLNYYQLSNNDRSGLVWNTPPTDPIGSAKLIYENETRMDMESLYYSLLQPYEHAKNVPNSNAMKGIMSLRNPSEVSGEAALTVGYHMYSYALKLENQDPCGSTNYDDLQNASLILKPSTSAVNNYINGQGPWRVFVTAINQNVIRIDKGGIDFPTL